MKKLIALLLAASLALSASGMALAAENDPVSAEEPVADVVDSGKVEQEEPTQPAIPEPPSDSALFAAASFELPESFKASRAATGNAFREKLANDVQKAIYDALLTYFCEVNSGTVTISKCIITADTIQDATSVADGAIDAATPEDGKAAMLAVFKDNPHLLYWVAKGGGNTHKFFVGDTTNSKKAVYGYFAVIESYKNGSGTDDTYTIAGGKTDAGTYYTVSAAKGDGDGDAKAAMEVANEIVKRSENAANYFYRYDRIKLFNDEICKLTSYDTAANADYGESSEMINVFLGKPAVSAGYAKAFKYLCDQAGIGCYLVEGSLEKGGSKVDHTWNLVELQVGGREHWYLVDVASNDGPVPDHKRFAIGSENALSKEYSLDRTGGGTPLNPDVEWYTKDFNTAPTPENPESLTLNVTCPGGQITFDVRNPDGTPYSYFEGTYKLLPEDITVTNSATGEKFHPSTKMQDIHSSAGLEWWYLFEPRIPEGKYTVSVKEDPCYIVTITPDTFEFKDTDVYPRYTFGEPDANGNVKMTIESSQKKGEIHYRINNSPWEKVPTPFVTTISLTEPDPYPLKWIESYVFLEGYERAPLEANQYNFRTDTNVFQFGVEPVQDLKGMIKDGQKVLMATLKPYKANGDVSYEIDGTRCGGFRIEGDKVYSKNQFLQGGHLLFIKATDSQGNVAYSNARILIKPGDGGDNPDEPDNPDNPDNPDGDGGGTTGGGNSGGSGGNSSSGGSILGGGATGGSSSSAISSATAAKDTAKSVKEAIANALKNHKNSAKATVSYKNKKSVSAAAIKAMVKAAQKAAKDKGVKVDLALQSDVVKNGKVESRMTIDLTENLPAADIKLGVKLENKIVADKFTEAFKTPVATITFDQPDGFGATVGLAVKLDLSELDTSNLTFFNYDAKTNTYTQQPTPAYYVDTAGYLHFETNVGNCLVITDKPLPSE